MNIKEIYAKRFQFLSKLYDVSGAKTNIFCQMCEDIGEPLGFDTALIDGIVQYLGDEGLIDNRRSGPHIGITHEGIREVEKACSKPDEPTPYFPPVSAVLVNNGNITNSPIQQAAPHAVQNLHLQASDNQMDEIRQFLTELKDQVEQLGLTPDARNDLDAEVMTIEAQMRSSKPRLSTIQECMKSMVKVLEGASGNVLATCFIEMAKVIVGA